VAETPTIPALGRAKPDKLDAGGAAARLAESGG